MLIRRRFPDFYSARATSHYPRSEDSDLSNTLGQAMGHFQLPNFLPPSKNPHPSITSCLATPGCKYSVFPGNKRRDVGWCLWLGEKEQVQALLKVVGV